MRPYCGFWTEQRYFEHTGRSFDAVSTVAPAHFSDYLSAYPPTTPGIYPSGQRAPRCGDPGFACGTFDDGEGGVCWSAMDCGPCPTCGDGTCTATEDCSTCEDDCGPCEALFPGEIVTPPGSVPNTGFEIAWLDGYGIGLDARTALFCQADGGAWDLEAAYGRASPITYSSPPPGSTITCKTRTRDANDYSNYVESDEVSWFVSSDYADIRVTDVALVSPPVPNGCGETNVQATIENLGSQAGTWRTRAWYHPAGAGPDSPDAIEARYSHNVSLDPGEFQVFSFRFFTGLQVPLSPGSWEVTVVVEDAYEGYGAPDEYTVDLVTSDNDDPSISLLRVLAYSGTPVSVLPGRTHDVQVEARDEFGVASVELAWRLPGDAWTVIGSETFDAVCATQEFLSFDWSVPGALAAGLTLEVRAVVVDRGGNQVTQVTEVVTRSTATPAVAFVAPAGGETLVRMQSDSPTCVPVDVYVTPGVPINRVYLGFANASDPTLVDIKETISLPAGGRVIDCLTATHAGDDLAVLVRVRDTNGLSFDFLSPSFSVEFPPPVAPWGPLVVESTQLPLAEPQVGAFTESNFLAPRPYGSSQFSVYRDEHAWWEEGSDTVLFRELSRVVFDASDFGLAAESFLLPAYTEVTDLGDPGSIRWIGVPPAYSSVPTIVWAEEDPDLCPDPWASPCDYTVYVREVFGGTPSARTLLGAYTSQPGPGPLALGSVLSPTGARLHLVRTGSSATGFVSDIYRATTGGYSRLLREARSLRSLTVADHMVHVFSYLRVGQGMDFVSEVVNESSGALESSRTVLEFADDRSIALPSADLVNGSLYVLGFESSTATLSLKRLVGSAWTDVASSTLPRSWRGNSLNGFAPQSLVVSDNVAYAVIQAYWSGGHQNLIVPIRGGVVTDIEDAFLEDEDIGLAFTVAGTGELVNAVTCSWNLETRLCLQRGSPNVAADCYSSDLCSPALWDAVSRACVSTSTSCPQDGDDCNGQEACDPETGACVSSGSTSVLCDDGSFCNGLETCMAPDGECADGVAPVVDDRVACTTDWCDDDAEAVQHEAEDDACVVDACHVATCEPDVPGADPMTGCFVTPRPVPSDGLACTTDLCDPTTGRSVYQPVADSCAIEGVCVAGGAANPVNECEWCDPTVSATRWTDRPSGATCDDGAFCTERDRCELGVCVGAPLLCAQPGDSCAVASCDEGADACVTATAAEGTPCDDFDRCNGRETCVDGECTAGAPPDLTSENPCVALSCDPVGGVLTEFVEGACDADGDGCTVGDSCQLGACVAGPAPTDCAALDNDCNVGLCLSTGTESHRCVLDPQPKEGDACDDGLYCNGSGTCGAGSCVYGSPVVVDDGVACTVDACGEVSHVTHVPDDGACEATACQAATCDPSNPLADASTGCVVEDVPGESDGLACTVDVCDAGTGGTRHDLLPGWCLVGGVCHEAGEENPANGCSICDPTASSTTWSTAADGASCDDGAFCNGTDSCLAGACAAHAEEPCDDGLACTSDACDESADACVNAPEVGFCVAEGECVPANDSACGTDTDDSDTDDGGGPGCSGCSSTSGSGGSWVLPLALLALKGRRRRQSPEA